MTKGEPSITDITAFAGYKKNDVLLLAAISEKGSEHPLAEAVMKAANKAKLKTPDAESFEAVPGHGVKASYKNKQVLFGNRRLMSVNGITITRDVEEALSGFEGQGKTAMILAVDGKIVGVVTAMDTPKENAAEAIKELKGMGFETAMLTATMKQPPKP